jgi:hypothetical protein
MHSQLKPISGDRLLHHQPKDAPRHGYKGFVKHDHSAGRVCCCWPSPAQPFLIPDLMGPMDIFFYLTSLTVNLTDNFIANKYSTHTWINYRQILREILYRDEVPIFLWLRHIINYICQWHVITSSPETPSNRPSLHVTYTLWRHAVFVQSLLWEQITLCQPNITYTGKLTNK